VSADQNSGEPRQRQELARAVSFRHYVTLGFGSVIGVGWILVGGDLLNDGGPLGTILAFLLGGLLFISIGKCYAELTPAIPVAGGEVAFAYKAFGPGLAFLTGWFLAFGYVSIGPFETASLGWLFEHMVPSARTAPLYTVGGFDVSLSTMIPGLAIGLLVVFINYRGVKNSAIFQLFTTVLLLICAVVFSVVAVFKGSFSNLVPLFAGGGGLWGGMVATIAVLGVVPFFMAGFDAIPQAAEESGEDVEPRDLGRAIIFTIIGGAVFYAVAIGAIAMCMPWREAVRLDLPPAEVFEAAFGYAWVSKMVLFTGFLGLVTSLNGIFIAATRVLFSAGRGGLLPAWFGEAHPRFHTPKNAIIFSGVLALLGPLLGKAVIIPIVDVASLMFVIAWCMTCIAAIVLRKTAADLERPYKLRSVATMYVGAAVSAALILLMVIPGSAAQLKWPLEYAIFAVWFVVGYALYRWRRSRDDMSEDERAFQILNQR
jgi:APA family basic amino acid/polyamine antiporter